MTTTAPKPCTSDRQIQLLRVIRESYANYAKRGQTHYDLNGMSTYHIHGKAIGDARALEVIWPPELIERQKYSGRVTYLMEEGTLAGIESTVRKSLDELATLGYLEKVGNSEERRWRLIKPKPKKQTRKAYDPDGKEHGHFQRWNDDDPWVFVADRVTPSKSK